MEKFKIGVLWVLLIAGLTVPTMATIINPWDSTFDASTPSDATLISDIDQVIIDAKQSIRGRLDVETAFSSLNANDTSNSGRLLPGAARLFVVDGDTGCSTITTLTNPDLNSSIALDEGRACWDKDDNEFCVWDMNAGPAAWDCQILSTTEPALPTGTVIFTANASCPSGYTDMSPTWDSHTIRIVDDNASDPAIPQTAGQLCPGGGECGAPTNNYDDIIDLNEMPDHDHEDLGVSVAAGGIAAGVRGNANSGGNVDGWAGPESVYHPFVALRPCQKS